MKKAAFFSILALVFAGWASQAGALQILIDAYWNATGTGSAGEHLQTGSIVQVVLFQTGGQEPSPTDPGSNFQPYGAGTWIPNSTKEGNQIIYTGTVTVSGNTAEFYQWVDIPNELLAVYDKFYLRVFEATEFSEGVASDSYWGIGDLEDIPDGGGGTAWSWFDDIAVTNLNSFEVIPEPGVISLLAAGICGLGGAAMRRRKHCDSKTEPNIRERANHE